jgi:uncharacterized protein (TIGR04255 family)
MSSQIKEITYKKPPIIERVISVVADISEENFYSRLESWKAIVQSDFPDYDPIKAWNLNIQMKGDVPVLEDSLPEVEVTHRFWKLNDHGQRFMSMRVLPNQFTLNLHPEPEQPHAFDELLRAFENWLPRWLSHFGGNGCQTIVLNYINLLSARTTPQFIANGGVKLGGVLSVFVGLPGRFTNIIPPYDCQIGLMIDAQKPALFQMRVVGLPSNEEGPSVRVDFQAQIIKNSACLTQNQVLAEAQFLHHIIREQFEALFTEAAKKTFQPE